MESTRPHAAVRDPVFMVGTTRSGTTLLGLMLDHHSQFAFAGELEWMFDQRPIDQEPPLDGYYEWLAAHRFFRWHQLNIDRSLPWQSLLRSFLVQMKEAASPTKPHTVASVHRHLRFASDIWPHARYIRLVRDGRDVAASWLRMGWEGNAWAAAERWAAELQDWDDIRDTIPESRRIEIRFEDLIADAPGVLRRICAMLGETYEPNMLSYPEDTTYDPVDPGQAGKWRTQLSQRQVRIFESIAGHHLKRHGYALSGLEPLKLTRLRKATLDLENRLAKNHARLRQFGPTLWLGDHVSRRLGLKNMQRSVQLRINAIINAGLK